MVVFDRKAALNARENCCSRSLAQLAQVGGSNRDSRGNLDLEAAESSLQNAIVTQTFSKRQAQAHQNPRRLGCGPGNSAELQRPPVGRLEQDVADSDLVQLAEYDFGRHRPSLGEDLGRCRRAFGLCA